MDGVHSLRTYLSVGVGYSMTAGVHLDRPQQIWIALYTSATTYIDEVPFRFPSEISSLYSFNDRFVEGKSQDNVVLNAFADIVRRTPDLYDSIPSKLITTSSLNFVTANLLEHETTSMQIANAAEHYPVYYRTMTALAEGFAYFAFAGGIPLKEYLQAIPEVMLFINDMNDVLSFYKEELDGENNNRIAVTARRNKESHLDAFTALAEVTVGHCQKTLQILHESPRAYEDYKRFVVGYIGFHTSMERYKLETLNL